MIKLLAKPLTQELEAEISAKAGHLSSKFHRKPKLCVVIVGADPASQIYVRKKGETALKLGMDSETVHFPADATPADVSKKVRELNMDPDIDGILIQRPLPRAFNEDEVMLWVDPAKDVDSFHPYNVGLLHLGREGLKPCTPWGVMAILDYYKIPVAGRTACVVGRSSIVGKPMAAFLLQANATVLQAHSHTKDLAHFTKQADILVAAAGKPKLIGAAHVKSGATVIDVGIHRLSDGSICGDVDFEAVSHVASGITPVPGGVGPMTIMMLLQNTLKAMEMRLG